MTVTEPAAVSTPVPAGRGRWKLSLVQRQFVANSLWTSRLLADLQTARSRQLTRQLNTPAQLTFTLDGHDPAAALAVELATDVVAQRWDEATGADVVMFRGPITSSVDQITEQSHTINFVCWDYLKLLERRLLTDTYATPDQITGIDQDALVAALVGLASSVSTSPPAAVSLNPGAYLPLVAAPVDGSGAARGASGQMRVRTYPAQTLLSEAVDNLAHVINGFDYDLLPLATGSGIAGQGPGFRDQLRVFFPAQGITRTSPELVYGSTVNTVTRSTSSADYGNYWRLLGNNGESDPNAPQRFSEAWNPDAGAGTVGSAGLWMSADSASDVTQQATLDQQVQGSLAEYGTLIPSYSLTLRPGFYRYGAPNMGDVVPLYVRSGRLQVATSLRVVGITWDVGDDGQEDVSLTVGRPPLTFAQVITGPLRDIRALVRR